MSTLILEELNLVTLNELLQRLPGETLVGDLIAIIGERELFTPVQAVQIVQTLSGHHVDKVSGDDQPHTVEKEIEDLKTLIKSQAGDWVGSFDLKLTGLLPQHVNQKAVIAVEVHDNKVLLSGYNPTVGRAFWPELSEILVAIYSENKLHQLRERIVTHFLKT